MSERYTRLFALSKDLYIDGSPVVISAGALLKDNDKDSVLVQLKFKSICRKVIKAVTVKIIPKDSAGRVLGESVEHKFLDISAKRNNEFAQKEPVYLSDSSTRAFSVYVSEVIFDDNSIWSCEDAGWETLPDEYIKFEDVELSKQYKLKYGNYAGKEPVYMNSIWKCTCGYINNSDEDKCQSCNIEIGKLKAFDIEQLKADCSARLEKEEQVRQEAKKRAEEEQKRLETEKKRLEAERELERQRLEAERKEAAKKHNKILAVVSGVAAVCIIVGVITTKVIIPEARYSKAITLIESESYDEAITLLEQLDTYKDAQQLYVDVQDEKIKYDLYVKACSELENEDYDNAILNFKSLSDYKDSKELLEKSIDAKNLPLYETAMSLFESGSYSEARIMFRALGDYKDSAEKANEAFLQPKYQTAMSLFENGSYREARVMFKELGDYKDSAEKVKQAESYTFEKELTAIKEGQYTAGDCIEFANYSWRILEINDNSMLIITEKIISDMKFSEKNSDDWENSSIRQYLNNDFYGNFTDIEKTIIMNTEVVTEVINYDNSQWDISSGNNTIDKVFLLSIEEVDKYFPTASDKIAKRVKLPVIWWLRTLRNEYSACIVNEKGDVSMYGADKKQKYGIRPAMWISLE